MRLGLLSWILVLVCLLCGAFVFLERVAAQQVPPPPAPPSCEQQVGSVYQKLVSDPQRYMPEQPGAKWDQQLQAIAAQVRINKTDAQQTAAGETQARANVSQLIETTRALNERLTTVQQELDTLKNGTQPK